MKRATRLEELTQALKPRPLEESELDEFYVETSDARDAVGSRRDEIADLLGPERDSAKVILVGHSGSGKSTELVKFRQEHEDRFIVSGFSLIREASIGHTSIETVLVLVVETLVKTLRDEGCEATEDTLEEIYGWFSEAFEITERELNLVGSAGLGVDTNAGFLGKLLGVSTYLKGDIKAGSKTLNKAITRENKRLSELAFQVNVLVKEARLSILKKCGKELLLVIEDLDKASVQEADDLFVHNPAPLAGLPCKAILTAPVFLFCNPRAQQLYTWFEVVRLPMIKLVESDGERFGEGWETLREILEHRMDLETLAETKAVDLVVEKTGGVLRHLFEALDKAGFAARQAVKRGRRTEERITRDDVRYGLNRLKTHLVGQIGVMGLPDDFSDVTTRQLWEHLRELADGPARTVEQDKINLLLLQAHALIEYNGAGWHRVHPLITEHLSS